MNKKKIVLFLLMILVIPTIMIGIKVSETEAHSGRVHKDILDYAINILENDKYRYSIYPYRIYPGMSQLVDELKANNNEFTERIKSGLVDIDTGGYSHISHCWDPINHRGIRIILASGAVVNPANWFEIHDGAVPSANYDFEMAVNLYKTGDKNGAYYYLGRALHMVQDVTIPYHTASDQFMVGINRFNQYFTIWEIITDLRKEFNSGTLVIDGIHRDFEDFIQSEISKMDISDFPQSNELYELESIFRPEPYGQLQYKNHYHAGSFVQSAALFGRTFYEEVNSNGINSPQWIFAAKKILNYNIKVSAMFLYYFWNCVSDTLDFDNDGLSGYEEYKNEIHIEIGDDIYCTIPLRYNPFNADSDFDGILDGDEPLTTYEDYWSFIDTDHDGLSDYYETSLDISSYHADTDGDGLNDGVEVLGVLNPYHPYSNDLGYILGLNPLLTDTDGDGLDDYLETKGILIPGHPGANSYGVVYTNPLDPDSDGDGINDWLEVICYNSNPHITDTDNDGLSDDYELTHGLDPNNPDTDNDGLPDGFEVEYGFLPLNPDSDNDGLLDGEEDSDDDGLINADEAAHNTNPWISDSDNDGLLDGEEVHNYLTNPLDADTDKDGLLDGQEVHGINVPGMGIIYTDPKKYSSDYRPGMTNPDYMSDGWEVIHGLNPNDYNDRNDDNDGDGLTNQEEFLFYYFMCLSMSPDPMLSSVYYCNPLEADTDGDGLLDSTEVLQVNFWLDGSNLIPDLVFICYPNAVDSDGDLWSDFDEYWENHFLDGYSNPLNPDFDQDGMLDGWEVKYNLSPNDPSDAHTDPDGDLLKNIYEFNFGTDPRNPDTDGDGIPDYDEWRMQLDGTANDASLDYDLDGLTNFQEYLYGTNPFKADSDRDGIDDYWEIFSYGTNPNRGDTDADKLSDYEEIYIYHTDPTNPDTDGDGLNDGYELEQKYEHLPTGETIGDPLDTYNPNNSPQNLILTQVENQPTKLYLSWIPLPGTGEYEIWVSTGEGFTKHSTAASDETTNYIIEGLTAGTLYYIKIRAKSAYIIDNYSEFSQVQSCRTIQPKPVTPTVAINTYITVTFTKSSSASEIQLLYRVGTGSWQVKGTYSSTSNVVTFSGITYRTTYEFKTLQRHSSDTYWSPESTTASVTINDPVPSALQDFYGLTDGYSFVSLVWKAPTNYLNGFYYQIHRKTGLGSYVLMAILPHSGSSSTTQIWTDNTITSSTTYTYKVTCFNTQNIAGPPSYYSVTIGSGGGFGFSSYNAVLGELNEQSTIKGNLLHFGYFFITIFIGLIAIFNSIYSKQNNRK